MADESVLAQGGAERIGLDEAFVKVTMKDGSKEKVMHDIDIPTSELLRTL